MIKNNVALTILLSTLSASTFAQYAYAPVITFNMANYDDHVHWNKRVELMADEIERNHAAIIVLQEVRFNPEAPSTKASNQNMAEQLLNALNQRNDFIGAGIVTQPAMYHGDSWEGLSIISKYRIEETGSRFLTKTPDCKDANLRTTQFVKLDVNGNDFIIANTHFGLTPICIKTNIQETADYLHRIAGNHGMLLLGDFNTTPDNPDLLLLKNSGLADVWATFHPGETGYTFPASHPNTRIDYVFANTKMLQRIDGRDYVRVIGSNHEGGVYPSDHLGLVTEFLAY